MNGNKRGNKTVIKESQNWILNKLSNHVIMCFMDYGSHYPEEKYNNYK